MNINLKIDVTPGTARRVAAIGTIFLVVGVVWAWSGAGPLLVLVSLLFAFQPGFAAGRWGPRRAKR